MKRKLFLVLAVPAVLGLALWTTSIDLGLPGLLLDAYTLALVLAVLVWLGSRFLRFFLWRVSRRLAFSYFLIGIVPLLLVVMLGLVAAYVFTGFYVGHLFRDAAYSLTGDLDAAARQHLRELAAGSLPRSATTVSARFAYYRDGKLVAGDAPKVWQPWWPAAHLDDDGEAEIPSPAMVEAPDGSPTLMAAVSDGHFGVVALYAGELERELSQRSNVWVELLRADDPEAQQASKVVLFNREYPIKRLQPGADRDELEEFLHPGVEEPGVLDRPWVIWIDVWQPFFDLDSGTHAAEYVAATLTTNLRTVKYSLIAGSADFGNWVYLLFVGLALLLFNIWVIAVMMAVLMIFSLSRAVNRMTDATRRVQRGDFSARIEVHRRDQIGALQASFNDMAENLEELVADAARQELVEKDLEIARELQRSLLPDPAALPAAAGLEFETYFEPSSAIGGDYYDLLPLPGDRLAVFIADVSGHGLSAGLRMAMVKSALLILCEKEDDPRDVLRQLHRLLRYGLHRGQRRGFVSATLAVVDLGRGELTIYNAGHPPTYLLRGGEVREIMLPSPALGGLDGEHGQETVALEAGDVVVWLSDGLIEAQNGDGDFGYERIVEALSGLGSDPAEVKEKLLGAVAEHTGGETPDDDLTVVVMAYRPGG